MPDPPDEKLRPPPPVPAEETFSSASVDYAELDITTNFSFLRGASHPDEFALQAARLGHRAVAIPDLNTLAGVVRMFDAARQIAKTGWGPKLIIGTRLAFDDAPDVLVWAPDRAAYARLCRLLTLGRRRAPKGECHLSLRDFLENSDGLLVGLVPSPGPFLETVNAIKPLRDVLGRDRLSLVITKNFAGDEETRLRNFLSLARRYDVPPVATNAVHYHEPYRRPLQDVLTCVRHQCTIREAGFRLFANGERYLKSPEQMHRLFADVPAALSRTMEIAERCTFSLDELRYEYPDEIVPAGKTAIRYLTELTWTGAGKRYPQGVPQKVVDLIHKELDFIEHFHWEPYFLTVHDLVRYARECDILCQGRGSAANSAVCYCLHVTSVDPNKIDVLFERFISAARGEPPDIDIDFEHERREEVIQYVYEKYGRARSGMTATVITYRGRSAVRDVGKALGLGLDVVDQLAKRLDWWHRGTLSDEQLKESGVDPSDPTVRGLIGLTAQLLGFPRHLSQHTGGMVMTRGPLCELVPIENASMEDRTVIEWDKDDIDALGILKVDVLALGMLTVISKAFKLLDDRYELATLPDEEAATYKMICDADTVGVFQIESRAQMSMLPRLRPKTFYDLVIEVAIVRPGPIQGNMVHPYLRRRQGEEPVSFPSDALRETLKNTLGVPLFQEQAMRVVMVAAGFSADEADKLRRAMAAWRKNGAINQFYPKIINGMLERGYTREFAEQTFQQIQGFGEYGFPESHAASFAILVYASAWIKRHHPAVFCAALLNSQPMGFYAPAQIVIDARAHGVEVRSVDVNESAWDCTLEAPCEACATASRPGLAESGSQDARDKSTWGRNGPAVRLGFRRIKGLQEPHANVIADIRGHCGRFTSVEQMHRLTGLPVSVMRRLAEADAFASLGLTRREALWHVMRLSDEELPLWECADLGDEEIPVALPVMPIGQEVMTDYATGGLSLKAHPCQLIREQLKERRIITAAELAKLDRGWVRVAGLVLIRQRPGTASGIVFETLEDETGVVNLIVRPDIYERYRPAARYAGLLECHGYVERQGKVIHVMAKRMFDLSPMLSGYQLESRDFH
jgi:error-prone DNA polymerase